MRSLLSPATEVSRATQKSYQAQVFCLHDSQGAKALGAAARRPEVRDVTVPQADRTLPGLWSLGQEREDESQASPQAGGARDLPDRQEIGTRDRSRLLRHHQRHRVRRVPP